MRFCTIASGSSGNCIYIEHKQTRILIDAGIGIRRINTSLLQLGVDPKRLSAVLITHEHIDHVRAVPSIAAKYGMPIMSSMAVLRALVSNCRDVMPDRFSAICEEDILIGDLRISSFETPHDSAGCVGYTITAENGRKLTVATDLGHISDSVRKKLLGADFAIIESNYDERMLMDGGYPYYLKKRVASPVGHLSNSDCGKCVTHLAQNGTEHFMLFHLSENNNTPALALKSSCECLSNEGFKPGDITVDVAPRHAPSCFFEL